MQAQTISTPMNIVGPYSMWPRRRVSFRTKMLSAAGVASAAVFVHCIAPML
ncbi:MAG: hypothetical protein LJE62_03415 [Silicimonas sp.]|nr:hypothetical protein [Silicimonas sp.]